jgi:hypothetical protein
VEACLDFLIRKIIEKGGSRDVNRPSLQQSVKLNAVIVSEAYPAAFLPAVGRVAAGLHTGALRHFLYSTKGQLIT